ncbi:MAG: NAD-dependent epimerase/dehydratase family protein [Candidatus Marinimicrobia bacterium]|nr:NAD-dependent epimerase/dehydratase family protein [Candidatus Neomarinimicrobiota bacterium]
MKRILVIGAAGQIGSELVVKLRKIYGDNNVIASDIRAQVPYDLKHGGPFEIVDCLDAHKIVDIIVKYNIDTVYNLVAILSAVGEAKPDMAWDINLGSLMNLLDLAKELKFAIFTPSSIGAFGNSTPKDRTPQTTIMRPSTIYGITKVAGELLCDYYNKKYEIDTRGVRFPGIISNMTKPGGGTTDYAVEIFYKAIQEKKFTCNLGAGTFLDMMYMPDAVDASIQIMEADSDKLRERNAYNVGAMSFDPEMLSSEIKKHIPEFQMSYKINDDLQKIADSWPNSIDDSYAREDWNWQHKFDISAMTEDMIKTLTKRLNE